MRVVAAGLLWIGNSQDARDAQKLFNTGISAVVDVAAEEPPAALPRDLIYCRVPLVDGAGNATPRIVLCLNAIAGLIRNREPTIVCCGAGMSRSVALAAAGYALATNADAHEGLAAYQAHNPHDVMPGFWNEVVSAMGRSRRQAAGG